MTKVWLTTSGLRSASRLFCQITYENSVHLVRYLKWCLRVSAVDFVGPTRRQPFTDSEAAELL